MTQPISTTPGLIILLGSGETLPSSGTTHDYVLQRLPKSPKLRVVETPAGFEPNSQAVALKIKTFLERRLQNYKPDIALVAARKQGTSHSPDDPEITAPLYNADEILFGPGSPTYCARQLKNSLALAITAARHRLGAAILLSSASTLAFGHFTMPVYEIYKVGQDLHWQEGLNFWQPLGLDFTVIPHWNNNDGGQDLDTSRCYLGQARFQALQNLLPAEHIIVGIDEHTSLVINFGEGRCLVGGRGVVHILRGQDGQHFPAGSDFSLDLLGQWHLPDPLATGIPDEVWQEAIERQTAAQTAVPPTPTNGRS